MVTPSRSNQDQMTRLMILASTLQDVTHDTRTTAPNPTLIGEAMEQVGKDMAGNAYLSEGDKTDFDSILSGSAATPNLEALAQNADNVELALTAGLMQKLDDIGYKANWPTVRGTMFQFTLESANKVPVELTLCDMDERSNQGILGRMVQVAMILNDPAAGGVTKVYIENTVDEVWFIKSGGDINLWGSSLSPAGFQTASRVDAALQKFKGGNEYDPYFETDAIYTGHLTMGDSGQVEASFFQSENTVIYRGLAALGDVSQLPVDVIQDKFTSNAGAQIKESFERMYGDDERALNEAAAASGITEMTNCGRAFARDYVELALDKCRLKVPYDQLTPQVLKQAEKARTNLASEPGFNGDIMMIDENTARILLFGTNVFEYNINSGEFSSGWDMLATKGEGDW